MKINFLYIICFTQLLVGCGGGGSNQPDIGIGIEEDIPGEVLHYDEDVKIDQSTELILFAPSNNLTNIAWIQTDGPDVEFYARNSKVIAFTPTESGSYSFQVDYVVDGLTAGTLRHTFSVVSEVSPLTIRLGHSVLEENAVSLASFADGEYQSTQLDKSSWVWEQIQGPSVTFSEE